jgi:hypothetical protein
MNQIEPYQVWVGHGGESHDFRHLLDIGIEAVVELAVEEPSFPCRRDMIACRFPLIDGVGNPPHLLGLAIGTVASLIEAQVPLLVCCGEGMSRAPAIVAAALAATRQEAPEQCLKRVTHHHPSDVSPGLWSEVCQAVRRGPGVMPRDGAS